MRNATRNTPWPTAEEEKTRLFNQAQAAAKKTQALGTTYSSSFHARSNSDVARPGNSSKPVNPVTPIPETSNAIASRSQPTSSGEAGGSSHADSYRAKPTPPPQAQYSAKVKAPVPQYPTAEEEKAALRRYHEAKLAVDRTQGYVPHSDGSQSSSNPISYDTLYPGSSSGSVPRSPPPGGNGFPPPFDAGVEKQSSLPEKERLRRAYEAQDAAALARQNSTRGNNGIGAYDYGRVSPPQAVGGNSFASGSRQDTTGLGNGRPPVSPPAPLRNGSYQATSRPTPAAPQVASGSRILSAVEEKAKLKAKYDAEERGSRRDGTPAPSVGSNSSSNVATPPTPPPLMPRPPAEYIQETQEEDARVSRYVQQGITPPLEMPINGVYKSFSPRNSGFEGGFPTPGPPPLLHRKVSVTQ